MATRTEPYRNFRFRVEIAGIQVAAFSNATIPEELSGQVIITFKSGITCSSTELYIGGGGSAPLAQA